MSCHIRVNFNVICISISHFCKIYFRKPWFQGHSLVIRGILVILTSISKFQTLIFQIFMHIIIFHHIVFDLFHLIFKFPNFTKILSENPDFKVIRGILVILTPISNFQVYFQNLFIISHVYIKGGMNLGLYLNNIR